MAAITLAQLRSTVRFRGDYQNVRKFPDADVNEVIQKAFGDFWQVVADAHQGYWDTLGNVSTTASTAYVALPSDAWRVQGVDRFDGTETIELLQVGLSDRNKFGATAGTPRAYRTTARGLDLYPTPDAVYTLRVMYTPTAPLLQESQPREWYNGWEDYVIEGALFRLDERERRPLSERVAMIEKLEKQLKSGAGERRSQEPEYLRLREFEGIDPFDERII